MPLRGYTTYHQWRRIAELLLEQGMFGVGLIDARLRIVGVNDAIERITGYPREELVGRSVAELVPEDPRHELEAAMAALTSGERASFSSELRASAKDGRDVWVKLAIWPLRDDDGSIDVCLGVMEDVTEARRETERARRIEERLREGMLILADARETRGVLQAVVDLAREVLGAEYAALGVLPETGTELTAFLVSGVGDDAIDAIGHWPIGKGLLGAVTASEEPIRLADLTRYPASVGFPAHHPAMRSFLGCRIAYKGRGLGNLYLANKVGAPDFTPEDEAALLALASQAAVVIENARMHETGQQLIDQLDRANRQLERASEAKSVFLASMSHELRTPLHALLLAADILRDPAFAVTEERARELSETIATSGRHLLGLIDDLLELSRIEAGRFEVRLQPTALNHLLMECRQATAPLASRKRIAFDVPQTENVWVEADPLRARQAIINLLANAVKFTPPGGRVWVEVDRSDETVTIAVCDTGRGIAPEDLERIFRPFEQAGYAHGVGLGLAISSSIARIHGAPLEVRSEPGRGSRFEMTLRLSRAEAPATTVPTGSVRPAGTETPVLVVEDDPRTLELTLEVLGSAGYSASGSATVAGALESLRGSRPDLVFLDVKLGDEDGLEVVRHLRADPTTRDIPVVAASASISDADVQRAKEAGCDAFLAKPLTPQALIAGIDAALAARRGAIDR
ncbi:MAG TPA: ATP-binding protein [Actinomycetota bacterium]|nr:ATP-binding protein [Actinomycetota bacterium]